MSESTNKDELLQCYTSEGIVSGTCTRKEIKSPSNNHWIAVARIWLVNDRGQILCSKRADGARTYPRLWQTYFGGHVAAGESILETARRELEEEIGVVKTTDDLHLIEKGRIESSKIFFESYVTKFNGEVADLSFTDDEVVDAQWMSMQEYVDERSRAPEEWCSECSRANQEAIKSWNTSI